MKTKRFVVISKSTSQAAASPLGVSSATPFSQRILIFPKKNKLIYIGKNEKPLKNRVTKLRVAKLALTLNYHSLNLSS